MKFIGLVLANFRRHKLRTLLTMSCIVVAFILFAYLSAIRKGFEMGVSVTYGPRRPKWIREAQQYISAHPQIKAISWFDESKPGSPVYDDLALHDQPSLAAFASLAQNPYFQP